MSEGKETNFFDKLKKDKKTRFEFIMAIWSGIIGVALVIGLFFVGKTFFFGKKVVDSGDLEDKPAGGGEGGGGGCCDRAGCGCRRDPGTI